MKPLQSLLKITGRMAITVLSLMLISWHLSLSPVMAENVVTGGTSIVITAGTTLISVDNLSLNSGASLKNSGVLVLKKNLTNGNALPNPTGTGTVEFSGAVNQTVNGQNILQNVTVNNSSGITLGGNTNVLGILALTKGNVALGSNNLLLGPSSSITGSPSAASMIVPTGTGELRKEFAAGFTSGSFIFPVGDETGTPGYSPVTLSISGGTFAPGSYTGLKLSNSAFTGSTGNYLNRYWTLAQNGITSPKYDALFQYLPTDVVGSEGMISCAKVDPLPAATFSAANSQLHQLNATGATSFGTFTGNATQLCTLAVSPSGQNALPAPASSVSFQVATGCNWTASSDQTWCTVTPSGTGNGTIVANYSQNITSNQRTAIVTITAPGASGSPQTVKVVQAGCTLPAKAGTIAGAITVNQGQKSVPYSVPVVSYANGYVWSVPTGATITSGNNTNSIVVDFSDIATSGAIRVYGLNDCGNGVVSPDFAVTVKPLPKLQMTVNAITVTDNHDGADDTGAFSVCNSATNNVSFTQVADLAGATPTSLVKVKREITLSNTTFTLGSSTNSLGAYSGLPLNLRVALVNPALPGILVMRYRIFLDINGNNVADAGEGTGDWVVYTVAVNPLPVAAGIITGATGFQSGSSGNPYSVAPITNAASYLWAYTGTGVTVNNAASPLSGYGVVLDFAAGATAGTLSVAGQNTCGSGAASKLNLSALLKAANNVGLVTNPDSLRLRTPALIGGIGNEVPGLPLKAIAVKNIEIRVIGKVSSGAVATLYDIPGRVVLTQKLEEGSLNVVPTSSISTGLYILSVNDKGRLQTFKLLLRK